MNIRPLFLLPLAVALPVCVRASVVSDPAPPASVPDTGPGAPLASIALSPDGTLLYSLDRSGELLARDIKTGATRFRGALGADATKLRILRGGSLLVGQSDGGVRLYARPVEGKALEARHFYFGEKSVAVTESDSAPLIELDDFVVSPDGTRFAVQTTETGRDTSGQFDYKFRTARIRVWKLADDRTPLELATFPAVQATPKIAWSDDKTLAVALPNVSVQRFDTTSGAAQSGWKPPATGAVKVDLAKEEAEFQRRKKMWPPDRQEGLQRSHDLAKERAAKVAADPNTPLDFGQTQGISGDGRLVLSATRNGLQLWNTSDNSSRILQKSEGVEGAEETLFSRDNGLVAVRSDTAFWLWNLNGTQTGWARTETANFSDLVFAPGGAQIMLGDTSGQVRIWKNSAPLAKAAGTAWPGFFQSWTALQSSSTSLWGRTSRGVGIVNLQNGVRWFDTPLLPAPEQLPAPVKAQMRPDVVDFAVAPDGLSWVESVSLSSFSPTMLRLNIAPGEVRARDAATGKLLWRLSNQSVHPVIVRFLPDGTLLTGGEGAGITRRRPTGAAPPSGQNFAGLRAWNGKTGEAHDFPIQWGNIITGLHEPGSVVILEPSADGKRLVVSSGSGGSGLQTLDLESKQVLTYFDENSDVSPGPWALSGDGHFLAGLSDDDLTIWDVSQPRGKNSDLKRGILLKSGIPSRATALAWNKQGALAAGFADGRVLVWAPYAESVPTPTWETAPGRAVTSLAWSQDGQTLSSGDERGDLKTRDGASGALQSTLRLMPPAKEGAPLAWIRWTSDGKITKPAP